MILLIQNKEFLLYTFTEKETELRLTYIHVSHFLARTSNQNKDDYQIMKTIWIHRNYSEFKNNRMSFCHYPHYYISLIVDLTKILNICIFERERERDFIQIVMILFSVTIYSDIIKWKKKDHLKIIFIGIINVFAYISRCHS